MCLQETTVNQAPAVATQLLNWFQQAVPGTATSSVNSCCSTSEDPCCSNIGVFFPCCGESNANAMGEIRVAFRLITSE